MGTNAWLDGGSSAPEIEIHVGPSEHLDDEHDLTLVEVLLPGWGTLADLYLNEEQVGQLIADLQRRPHTMPAMAGGSPTLQQP